jgi:2-keto-4-pentenoate hydratase/2-oxohepta-3-ene-1,7-dioic acid hydratase in catechol pathway
MCHAANGGDRWLRIEGDLFGEYSVTDIPVEPVERLAPILPSAILCIGLNYRRHAAETGGTPPEFPILFMKPPGTVQDPDKPIFLPRHLRSDEVDYEVELAAVIGRDCKNATPESALDFVLGYTCANDVSARDWQLRRSGRQWCRAKSFDTFCPLGPELVTGDSIGDPQNLRLSTTVNGEVLQDSNTADMIFTVRELIAFLSGSTTLPAGTVILTGTPEGVGMARNPPVWLRPGDRVAVEIEGIGRLCNPVEEEKDPRE